MKIKVGIADDHQIVVTGLQKMIQDNNSLVLCSVAQNGRTLLDNLRKQQPDVLLLDIQMPDQQGDELTRIISKQYPKIKILVLTNMDQIFYVRHLIKNGATGYLLKSTDSDTLFEAITAVYRGEQYIDKSLQQQIDAELLDLDKAQGIPTLTRREQEILELIADELTSAAIAKKLFITLSTVENHRINLFLKLGVKNAVGLVKKGKQLGLIK